MHLYTFKSFHYRYFSLSRYCRVRMIHPVLFENESLAMLDSCFSLLEQDDR
jgi:hypothetical protein